MRRQGGDGDGPWSEGVPQTFPPLTRSGGHVDEPGAVQLQALEEGRDSGRVVGRASDSGGAGGGTVRIPSPGANSDGGDAARPPN